MVRYVPIETGTGLDDLREGDLIDIEDDAIIRCKWQGYDYTGEIGEVRRAAIKDGWQSEVGSRKGALYLVRWRSEHNGTTSEGLTTFPTDRHNDHAAPTKIEVEFAGEWHGFKKEAVAKATASEGPYKTYHVTHWHGTPKKKELLEDHQGRALEHGAEMDFTAEDIVRLTEKFDVGIANGDVLCLDRKGGFWRQRG